MDNSVLARLAVPTEPELLLTFEELQGVLFSTAGQVGAAQSVSLSAAALSSVPITGLLCPDGKQIKGRGSLFMPRKIAVSTLAQKGHLPVSFDITRVLLATSPVGLSALVGGRALSTR